MFFFFLQFVLAHLSTTCSKGAFSEVRCPSCIVNNFFKHLLLPNCWANLDQTWQECFLGGPLQKLFTEFDSIKNSGCHGNEIEFLKQFFKNLLLWNRWSDFEIISQECSLGDPFQKLVAKLWSVYKYGSSEWGFLLYTNMKKFLKNLVLRNCWSDFEIISQESGFDISRRPDCPIRAVIATGKLPWPFVSPPGK